MAKRKVVEIPELDIIVEEEWVDVVLAELVSTEEYQRRFSPGKAAAIDRQFHPLAIGHLVVSCRDDGRKVLVDARHRLWVLRKRGFVTWKAQLLYGLTIAEEARLFTFLNTQRANPRAFEVWRSRKVYADPIVMACERVLAAEGWRICQTRGCGCTRAVRMIEELYGYGEEALRKILRLAQAAWPEDPNHGEAYVLGGIAKFLQSVRPTITPDVYDGLLRKWSACNLQSILQRAKGKQQFEGVHGRDAVARVLLEVSNKGRRCNVLRLGTNGEK